MASEIQITKGIQTRPIYDSAQRPGIAPMFTNPSAVDVYLDDEPTLLNASQSGTVPISGVRLPANTLLPVYLFTVNDGQRKIYGRAAADTTIFIL